MNRSSSYSGRDMAYVRVSIGKMPFKEIAEALQVSVAVLKKQCWVWRERGYRIPYERKVDVGTITTRTEHGKSVRYQKTQFGWERLAMDVISVRRTARVKKVIKPLITSAVRMPAKPENKRMKPIPTRLPDKNKIPFFIPELRMTVMVSPHANTTEVRTKYLDQREFNLKRALA